MAMDTAEKRRSAAGVPFLPLGPGVTPNSGKDQEWRQQAGWGYSGIAAEAEVFSLPGTRAVRRSAGRASLASAGRGRARGKGRGEYGAQG